MTTDSDVIRQSLDQPAAFGELYSRHARLVYRYAASRIGVQHADDVLSNTFLAAFERRRRFNHEYTSALPWLLGFATLAIRQHRRDEQRHLAEPYSEDAALTLGSSTAGSTASVAELMEVMTAVRGLRSSERDALMLHVSADLPYEEVAVALDVPIGTVRSRIHRARTRLRKATGRSLAPEKEEHHGRTATASLSD